MVSVVGRKKSGKTVTIESLIKKLTERGFRVAAVKHIPESNFTIDKEGKDTWRFAQAGARTVIGVSAGEIATFEKAPTERLLLREILSRTGDVDIVLIEGFRSQVEKAEDIFKIVVTRSREEEDEARVIFTPILAFAWPHQFEESGDIPHVNMADDSDRLVDIVERAILEKR